MRHYKLWIFLVTKLSSDRILPLLLKEGFGLEPIANSKKICSDCNVFGAYLTSSKEKLPTDEEKTAFSSKLQALLLEEQIPYSGYLLQTCNDGGSSWAGGNLDKLKPNLKPDEGTIQIITSAKTKN